MSYQDDPIDWTIVGCVLALVIATVLALAIVGLLASLFVELAR